MSTVIVSCTFNPPVVVIQGARIREDTLEHLQNALPKCTTTSPATQRHAETPAFLPFGEDDNKEAGHDENKMKGWKLSLKQHYCCQKCRSMIFMEIMSSLQDEGFAMRGVHSFLQEDSTDVTRMIFMPA